MENQQIGMSVVIQGSSAAIRSVQFLLQYFHLGCRQGRYLLCAFGGGGENCAEAGVAREDARNQSVLIAGMESIVYFLDTGIGKLFLLMQMVDELLYIVQGVLIELLLAEEGEDVIAYAAFQTVKAQWLQLWKLIGFQPEIKIGCH